VAVIAGGVLMQLSGRMWIDAAVGILLALWILRWAWHVILDSGHVLLESTPRHVRTEKLISDLRGLDSRVEGVDDLHVWELTSRMYAATAEVRVREMSLGETETLRQKMHQHLKEEFGIAHVVLAIRPAR
jgi:cobalt-zinc-cadmium efflux system protein